MTKARLDATAVGPPLASNLLGDNAYVVDIESEEQLDLIRQMDQASEQQLLQQPRVQRSTGSTGKAQVPSVPQASVCAALNLAGGGRSLVGTKPTVASGEAPDADEASQAFNQASQSAMGHQLMTASQVSLLADQM